jgi:hypothetical protein
MTPMSANDVERYMASTLRAVRFHFDQADANVIYGELPAWAVFYRGPDCKLQVCWSAREGGVDFMLAPLDAPNEYGLINRSKKWRFMLALSDATDDLGAPPLGTDTDQVWAWRKAIFDAHFKSAHDALVGKTIRDA